MDCLDGMKQIPDGTIDCCVTSPPYYALRDYGVDGQIGLEETPQKYIEKLTDVFMEVYRVLKPEGTLWLNIGDSYNGYKGNAKSEHNDSAFVGGHGGHPTREGKFGLEDKNIKPKDLIGIPWMLAFSLRNAGWYLRQDIIWHKPNPMPESVTDRCTKSHEYIFLFSKSPKYYYDYKAIQEDAKPESELRYKSVFNKGKSQEHFRPNGATNTEGMKNWTGKRNKRDVWSVNVHGDSIAHFATYPEDLIRPCILAGCPSGGIVLDPFMGSGTTALMASRLKRNYIGSEISSNYVEMANKRIKQEQSQLSLF